MSLEPELIRKIIEGALMASSAPLSVTKIQNLFKPSEEELDLEEQAVKAPSKEEIQAFLEDIQADTQKRGFELKEVGTGWRFQVVQETAPWISRLWEEKPAKYSRALMETLALITYRQPITRGDIESIRGVAVSSNIIKTLTEREWVKVVGHRDVPGRPALYATTKEFLDYFNITSLDELPSLKEIQDIEQAGTELELLVGDQEKAQLENGEQAEGEISEGDDLLADANSDSDDDLVEETVVEESAADDNMSESEEDEAIPSNVVHLDPH